MDYLEFINPQCSEFLLYLSLFMGVALVRIIKKDLKQGMKK